MTAVAGGDLHSAGGVLGAGLCHLGHRRAGRGLEDLEGAAFRRRCSLAAQQQLLDHVVHPPMDPSLLGPDHRHSMLATSTGSATPFRVTSRASEARTSSPASATVSALTRISPPSARAAILAATWTCAPL